MSRRRCCCIGPCRILAEGNPFADEEIPDSLEVVSGVWTSAQGDENEELRESGTPNAIIITTAEFVTIHGDMLVRSDISMRVGTVHRLILNYRHLPEIEYAYVEIDQGAGKLRLGHSTVGVLIEDDLVDSSPGQEFAFNGCIQHNGLLYGEIEDVQWLHAESPFNADGIHGGMGNGGSMPVLFGSFTLLEHKLHAVACPICMCTCEGEIPPQTMTSTFWDVLNCGPLDGLEITWVIDHTEDPLIYVPESQLVDCGEETCTLDGTLSCGPDDKLNWTLAFGGITDCMATATPYEPGLATCIPHYFLFGNIRMDEDHAGCCPVPIDNEGIIDIEFTE